MMKPKSPFTTIVTLGIMVALCSLSPVTHAATSVSDKDWTPIDQLKPIASGPGVVVTEPVSNDKTLADFGAGCARWLHLNVSSNPAFEKTPEWEALALTVLTSPTKNLRLTPEEAKVLFKRLAVSRVATSTIAKNQKGLVFKWQIWELPELKLIGEIEKEMPTRDAMVKALPEIGQDLVAKLGGDAKFYKENEITSTLSADDLTFMGSLPWEPGYDTSSEDISRMEKLSGTSLLANLFYLAYLSNVQAPIFTEDTLTKWKKAMGQLLIAAYPAPVTSRKINNFAMEYLGWLNINNKGHYNYPAFGLHVKYRNNYLACLREAMEHQQDISQMLKMTERAVQLNSNSARAWYNLSKVYVRIGQDKRKGRVTNALTKEELTFLNKVYAQELAAAQKCVELDDSNGYYWLNLSIAATFAGNWQLAEKAMDKSLLLIPDKGFVYVWALEMYQAKWHSNPQKFMEAWEQCFQHPAALAVAISQMVNVRQQFGGNREDIMKLVQRTRSALQPYSETHPYNIQVLYTLGDIGIAMGQPKMAKPPLEKLKKLLPNDKTIDKMLHKTETMPTWVQ